MLSDIETLLRDIKKTHRTITPTHVPRGTAFISSCLCLVCPNPAKHQTVSLTL
jgi:hypothetical protein